MIAGGRRDIDVLHRHSGKHRHAQRHTQVHIHMFKHYIASCLAHVLSMAGLSEHKEVG